MLNIFNDGKLTIYGEKWNVVNTRKFNEEEIACVKSAVITDSQYGKSVCFFLREGGMTYIPLSNTSSKTVGETVQLADCHLLTLERNGETIERIDC